MVRAFVLLAVCTALGFMYTKNVEKIYNIGGESGYAVTPRADLWFVILLIVMVLFSGLRTQMNDTIHYVRSFLNNVETTTGFRTLFRVSWDINTHPMFVVFQRLVKTIFGANSQWFIMCHAIIVVSSYLLFLKKYSHNFMWSLFVLMAFAVYGFSMAAMKQTMSIAVGIWAIPLFNEKKYIRSILIMLIAMFFHPFVFILFACNFLSDGVWTKKSWIVIAVSVVFFLLFSQYVDSASDLAEQFGKEYDYENLTSSGVGIQRIIAYSIIPALSFLCRKEINAKHDSMVNITVNASLISFCFMLLAFNGGAVLLGRIPAYFNVLTCVALPSILDNQKTEYRGIIKVIFVVLMLVYYYSYYDLYVDTYCGGDLFGDIYNHASISSLF